jgi:hypothetical protein
MNRLPIALSLAMLGATVFVLSAQAQRHGSAPSGRVGTAVSRGRSIRPGSLPLRRTRRGFAGSGFAPYYYSDYDDYGYGDYDYTPGIEAPPPPIMAAPLAQPSSMAPVPKPPEPLVIELQGDHWVRITPYGSPQGAGASNQPEAERASNQTSPSSPVPPATRRRIQPAQPAIAVQPAITELPPAVLVFRDGHQEEVGKYTIMGSTIYISTDYWTSGSWTRKVQIAELDVPTTLKLNQERRTNFKLPSGPNEVMVRP